MAWGSPAYLSARPASLLTAQVPYDDLLKSLEGFAERLYEYAFRRLRAVNWTYVLSHHRERIAIGSSHQKEVCNTYRRFADGPTACEQGRVRVPLEPVTKPP